MARSAARARPADDVVRLVNGELADPHRVLGLHDGVLRVYRPGATAVAAVNGERGTGTAPLVQVDPAGVFEGPVASATYRLAVTYPDAEVEIDDPYRFWPTLGDLDLHLIGEGRHRHLYRALGGRPIVHQGVAGVAFAVWAPSARGVRVVGDFNLWDGRPYPMRVMGSSGIWELFIPGVPLGSRYKYEITAADGRRLLKADPMATATEVPPGTSSVVAASTYAWGDDVWLDARARSDPWHERMSIYEAHLGSWRQGLSYRELADQLPDYVAGLGFTHVELLPVAEHPFGGSWGYQVSSYYAPTARYGSPDDFRALVDAFHQRGIGVIVDWVPAHFPRDDWALARFDGSALYEHADPRQGSHPDWGTLVFNFGRHEVRNFLVSNAVYWLEEFHVDGLRVDAVASMLYLDYSREEGEWVPNHYGGRENLDAVTFLRELNQVVHESQPGVLMVAEESTAWPAVSRPTHLGGLGFGFKWNMGWMHDTLQYFSKEPIHRRFHHHDLTFGLLYAFTENFVLPLSHDEVVHGKGSLLAKMPGDDWQQRANLRALFAWMWAHPGKELLFMGGELAQPWEWSSDAELPWHLLDDPRHRGVHDLLVALNRAATELPALWRRDFEAEGFQWIDANDADNNAFSFLRFAEGGEAGGAVACIANLSPVVRTDYRIGLPFGGEWREVLNTDAAEFGGSGVGNAGAVVAELTPFHGLPYSARVTLPPLGVLWLTR